MASRIQLDRIAAQKLALAMVECSEAPLLLLDGDLAVLSASASFGRAFQIDPEAVVGRSIFEIGAGEWDRRQFRSLLKATGSGSADVAGYEMDLERKGKEPRRLVINARNLKFGEADSVRLLVTISDVTEARVAEKLKDDLLRDKAILLQEIHNRVANSLQIIASVLMQSARKVSSKETRLHLKDAHSRVMSIANVQKQLAASHVGDVELGPYLAQLCDSLGASMIADHDKLSIDVNTDKSVVTADTSISLGLIVTELVINALKHAFPDDRQGKISVGYQSQGPNWTLSVGDDGIGMPEDSVGAKPGLGTSLIEALARQLRARVKVTAKSPGTDVAIIHAQVAAVENKPANTAV
jgi:two-component sensor histidine kinase